MPVKSTVEISQNFVAFLEYMNFKKQSFVIDFDTKKYLASFNTNLIPTYEFLVALMDAIIMLGKFNFHQNSLG